MEIEPGPGSQLPDERDAKRTSSFLRAFFGCSIGALLGIAMLNAIVDPMAIYGTHLLRPMTWSSRKEKSQLLRAAPKPGLVVLGSSRSMKLAPRTLEGLTGLRAFNAAVDSGRAEDYYALLRSLVEVHGANLKLLVIGVDLEAFHDHWPVDDGTLQMPELAQFLRPEDASGHAVDSYLKLVSAQQTKLSAISVSSWLLKRPVGTSHFEADGFLRYDDWEAERATGHYDFESKLQTSIRDYKARFQDFLGLSSNRKDYFVETLRYAESHSIRVVAFLTTLHARVIDALGPRYQARYSEALSFVMPTCATYHATCVDFSTVERFGGTADGFYDGGHVNDDNADEIIRHLPLNALQ